MRRLEGGEAGRVYSTRFGPWTVLAGGRNGARVAAPSGTRGMVSDGWVFSPAQIESTPRVITTRLISTSATDNTYPFSSHWRAIERRQGIDWLK